jgi:hypothetical protein
MTSKSAPTVFDRGADYWCDLAPLYVNSGGHLQFIETVI